MKKYTYINTAVFRGGNTIPLFRIFDTDTKETYYEAYVYGKDIRGKVSVTDKFSHETRNAVARWRQSRGQRK